MQIEQDEAIDTLERAPVALLRVSLENRKLQRHRNAWALAAFVLLAVVVVLGATLVALLNR